MVQILRGRGYYVRISPQWLGCADYSDNQEGRRLYQAWPLHRAVAGEQVDISEQPCVLASSISNRTGKPPQSGGFGLEKGDA